MKAPRFDRADFPPSKGWTKRVARANRPMMSAYKRTKKEINFLEIVQMFKADDACRAYLRDHGPYCGVPAEGGRR